MKRDGPVVLQKKYSDDRSSSCCEARSAQREAPVSVQKEVCDVEVSFMYPILGLEFSKRRRIFRRERSIFTKSGT